MERFLPVFVLYSQQHENTISLKCKCMTDQEKKRWRHCLKNMLCVHINSVHNVCARLGCMCVCERVCAHSHSALSQQPRSSVHTCLESTCPRASFLRQWPLVKPLFSALMMSSSQRWERWTLSWGTVALIMGNNAGEKKNNKKKKERKTLPTSSSKDEESSGSRE